MKKTFLTVVSTLACVAALAQGKIAFKNDSLHLAYFDPDPAKLRPQDSALAGQGPQSTVQPTGVTLVADLYAGTSASSLALVSTTTFTAIAGTLTLANTVLPSPLAGGSPWFFQVQIRDNTFASASNAFAGGGYSGFSPIFSTVPGSGALYNSIVSSASPANSTFAAGAYDMSTAYGAAGARGAIDISIAPEPSTFALAGLGVAAMTIFRRRNQRV